MSVFATRLRTVREKRGWSQRELAKRCGFSFNQISRYENDLVEPSISAFQAIARELEVSADYLLGFAPESDDVPAYGIVESGEDELLKTYRREGWAGIARLSVEKLTK